MTEEQGRPRLTHVRLLVDDYAACFRFYRDVMGFAPTYGDEDGGYADFDARADVSLALFARASQAGHLGGAPAEASGDRVAVILAVPSVDATLDELRARGAPVAGEPADRPDWGIRVAYVRDPDGTLIELNQPIEMADA